MADKRGESQVYTTPLYGAPLSTIAASAPASPANSARVGKGGGLPSTASRPYPSSEEARQDVEAYGFGYGSGFEGSLVQNARVINSAGLRGTEDQIFDQIAKKAATEDLRAGDIFRRAAVAANRSAITGLGFDPKHIAIDLSGKKHEDYGAYDDKADTIWMSLEDPSTAVHESTHRGLEMLRKAKVLSPDELKFIDKYDEEVVRYLMFHAMGDPESYPADSPMTPGRAEYDEARRMFTRGPNALQFRSIMDGIEKKAAALVAQRRQFGPR